MDLPLASGQLIGVDVGGFEGGEVQLDGRGVVGVRASEDDRDLVDTEELHHRGGLVIGCSVEQDDGVLSPPRFFLIKLLQEPPKEHDHGF